MVLIHFIVGQRSRRTYWSGDINKLIVPVVVSSAEINLLYLIVNDDSAPHMCTMVGTLTLTIWFINALKWKRILR